MSDMAHAMGARGQSAGCNQQAALPPPSRKKAQWRQASRQDRALTRTDPAVAPKRRLVGIDAARGFALVGMMAVHMLPSTNDRTGDATLTWWLFSGNSAALFAFLAGIGLALSSGGMRPHSGRVMTADRVGLAVRALLIAVLGMVIGAFMPPDPAAFSILLYYGMFFVLAIPFLSAGPKVVFGSAAVLLVVSPVLVHGLSDQLPEWQSYNPSFVDVVEAPAATLGQLLVTGTYPALTYLVYLLVGLGVGRMDLRRVELQRWLIAVGLALTVVARLISAFLLYAVGGYAHLLSSTGMSRGELSDALTWGPDGPTPESWWWLAVTTPHAETPLSMLASLGLAIAALGVFLLLARRVESWLLPLSAMGAMTLTLYSVHLFVLAAEWHEELPYLVFGINLLLACGFAVVWQRAVGRGPLELGITRIVTRTRRRIDPQPELMT